MECTTEYAFNLQDYSGIIRVELFYKTSQVKIDVYIITVQFHLQISIFMDATLTSVYNFQYRRLKAYSVVCYTYSKISLKVAL